MADLTAKTNIDGGSQTVFIGVGTVSASSIIINNYSGAAPDVVAPSEELGNCPYPGLAYFGPNDAARLSVAVRRSATWRRRSAGRV